MKKFSTAALILALGSAFSLGFAASAHAAGKKSSCEFLANAPDSHTVVRGDTLWGISGKFLQNPWCWPEVWGLNKDQIRDPHWIYPGQVVYFDRATGRLGLNKPTGGSGKGGDVASVRLSPQMRIEGLGQQAIPAIPSKDIEPFLSQPLIIEANEFQDTPRIVAADDGHVFMGKNDKAYVRGELKEDTAFQVFRPGQPLKDPVTKKILGYEAVYLGAVKLQRAAKTPQEAHTFAVVASKEEMAAGDRLVPVPPTPLMNYVPHAPEKRIDGNIVSVYGGVIQAGQYQIVTVNKGKNDGLDIGSVLELHRLGKVIVDRTDKKKELVKLPDQKYGALFIFRVFNGISYGLVMQVRDSVQIGDVAKSPE